MTAFPRKTPVIFLLAAFGAMAQVPPPSAARPNGPAPVLQEQPQVSFSGSVATGTVSATPVALSLRDAIQRGLRYNLGILTSRDIADTVKAERRRTLSTLLPNVYAGATQASQQIDLAAFGFNAPGIPQISGPFGYQNVRGFVEQTVYDRTSLKNLSRRRKARKPRS
jgi:hypothetical protein